MSSVISMCKCKPLPHSRLWKTVADTAASIASRSTRPSGGRSMAAGRNSNLQISTVTSTSVRLAPHASLTTHRAAALALAFRGFLRGLGCLGGFELFVLARQRRVFLGQSIDFATQIRIFFLEFGHLRLELLILLAGFRILTADQRQTQCQHQQ